MLMVMAVLHLSDVPIVNDETAFEALKARLNSAGIDMVMWTEFWQAVAPYFAPPPPPADKPAKAKPETEERPPEAPAVKRQMSAPRSTYDLVWKAFTKFDPSGGGFIENSKVKEALQSLGTWRLLCAGFPSSI